MSTTLASTTIATPPTPKKGHGFSISQGADWSSYLAYRPLYPASFFNRIYAYHAQKPSATWNTAHDIGAGCGIVSSKLASRFDQIVVSDPNDGYVTLARKLLVQDSGLSEEKFMFLQEGAEKSSVAAGTVDCVAVCECIHWTDTAAAIREFARELKVGGTLVVSHYTVPRIRGNAEAERIWGRVWEEYSVRATGELLEKAFPVVNSAFECLEFPEGEWEKVRRVYVNAGGSLEPFRMNGLIGERRVKDGEEVVWEEGDADWWDEQGIEWFKGYLATWVPRIPESDIQGLWDELEMALKGAKVRIETPFVMVFATKKA